AVELLVDRIILRGPEKTIHVPRGLPQSVVQHAARCIEPVIRDVLVVSWVHTLWNRLRLIFRGWVARACRSLARVDRALGVDFDGRAGIGRPLSGLDGLHGVALD